MSARTAELGQVNAMLEAAYAELNSNFTLALTVFAGLLEMRQDGIAGHSRRVAALARRMAAQLGMNERAQQDVHIGALLHDIGKIGFPDAMLGKPVSSYTPNEVTCYRRHPPDGEAALMPLVQLHGAARIVAVASDYDGLISGALSERKYSTEMARQSMRSAVATRYDGRVVDALFEVLSQGNTAAMPTVEVEVRELQPGMVLAQDLLSPKGAILLVAGMAVEARVIRQLGTLVARDGLRVMLTILRRSAPVACAGAVSVAAPVASCATGQPGCTAAMNLCARTLRCAGCAAVRLDVSPASADRTAGTGGGRRPPGSGRRHPRVPVRQRPAASPGPAQG